MSEIRTGLLVKVTAKSGAAVRKRPSARFEAKLAPHMRLKAGPKVVIRNSLVNVSTLIYLSLVVFAFNCAPAFAPPTWSVLVLFSFNSDLHPVVIILFGALSAGLGRYVLATYTGLLRFRIKGKSLENLQSAQKVLEEKSSRKIVLVLLFMVSPLPSAQLFEAAGLVGAKLLPLTVAFFSGRLVTYSFYVAGASELKSRGISELITKELTSVWAILLQIAMIAVLVLLTRINWSRFHTKKKSES